ncbi:MAG: hypothetical protein ABR583_02980 [Gaiellaceae bacterium]
MNVVDVLAGLQEIAPRVRAVAVLDGEGTVTAATLPDPEPFARAVGELLGSADALRRTQGRSLTRVRVTTRDGDVYAVRDGGRTLVAAAEKGALPALVFHDLEACLQRLGRETAGAAG